MPDPRGLEAITSPSTPQLPVLEACVEELVPLGFHGAVAEFKRRLLALAIARCSGNRSEAARLLGLQRTYLYKLTRQLGDSGDDAKLA